MDSNKTSFFKEQMASLPEMGAKHKFNIHLKNGSILRNKQIDDYEFAVDNVEAGYICFFNQSTLEECYVFLEDICAIEIIEGE